MLRRRLLTGRLVAACTGGRCGWLDADTLAVVARLVHEQNDLTLAELCASMAAERGVHVSVPMMYRAVRRLRLAYPKSCSTLPSVRPRACMPRPYFRDVSATLDLHRVTFIDELGIHLMLTRLYGRAPPARARHLTRRSRMRWVPSQRWMHGHGSPVAAMSYTKLKIALVCYGCEMPPM